MGQHEQDDLTTGMTLQMVPFNTLGQLERGHLERGVLNVAPEILAALYSTNVKAGSYTCNHMYCNYLHHPR